MTLDPALLRAALIGYENQLAEIEKAIAELRRKLKIASPGVAAPVKTGRRGMSAAARRRIAAAQKKRWAAYRKAKKGK
jgi:multidrug resistance efflux pump